MSARGVKIVLWLCLLVTLPVPYYMGEVETAPVIRPAFFASLGAIVVATSGTFGLGGMMTVFGLVQVVVWASLLYLASSLAARLLCRALGETGRAWAVGAIAVALVAMGMTPIYETRLSSLTPHSSLLEIFR